MPTTFLLAVAAFASTNIDDVFLLLGFFADRTFRRRHVIIGQFLGIGTLVVAGLVCSLVALIIPPAYIGLLGLLPILIGVKKLWDARSNAGNEKHPAAGAHKILAVAAVTAANGGDNIAVYVPMFATRDMSEWVLIIAVFAVMTAFWCLGALYLVGHRALGAPLRRYGHLILPFVLIAIGIFIVLENNTLHLVRRPSPG